MQSEFAIKPISDTSVVQPVRQLTPFELKPALPEQKPSKTVEPSKPEDENNEQENVRQLQDFFNENGITLKFSRDDKTNSVVVELIDQKSGEAVRQIPSEISLKLAAEFSKLQGQFFSKKV